MGSSRPAKEKTSDLPPAANPQTSRRLLWLFAISALLLFLGYGVLDDDEATFGLIIRNLIAGNLIDPLTVNGAIKTDIPRFAVLLTGLPSFLFGVVTEVLLRLPSALGALGVLAATLHFCRRLPGAAANTAGWLLLGSFGFLHFGRFAGSDIIFAAVVLWAAAYLANRPAAKFGDFLFFFLIAVPAGWLKGPPAILLPLAIALPFLRRNGESRFSQACAFAGALLCGVTVFLLPYLWEHHGDFTALGCAVWSDCVLHANRLLHQSAPPGRFFAEFLRLCFPWLLFNLAALFAIVRHFGTLERAAVDLIRGLLLASLLLLVCGARKWDHMLPLLPLVQMLTAVALVKPEYDRYFQPMQLIMRLLVIIIASLSIISMLLLPFWHRLFQFNPPQLFLIGLPLFGLLSIAVMILDENRPLYLEGKTALPRQFAATLVGGTIFAAGIFGWLVPSWDELLPIRGFISSVPANLRDIPDGNFLFFRREPTDRTLYYLDSRQVIATAHTAEELEEFAERHRNETIAVFLYAREREEIDMPAILENSRLPVGRETPDFEEEFWRFENRDNRKLKIWIVNLQGKG